MDDGPIIARKVTLYVDAGAYSRHSPYGTTKAAAHMPGPVHDPERLGRRPLRLHQPHAVERDARLRRHDRRLRARDRRWTGSRARSSIDPLQLRLSNAYRDGDMKAHRKRAEGTALIEVIQRAAELVGHELPEEYRAMSSTEERLHGQLRGRGYAAVNYPTGMNLGGDPSQALIHSTTTGTFVVTLSSVDLGQGIKTIAAQCAAETLGLPYRERARRHRRHRHRPALHGHVRQPRHPPRRQRRDHGRARGARGDAAGRRRGARGRRGRPRDRRHGLHQAQGLRGEEDPHRRPGARRALQARPHDLRPRHLPQGEVRAGARDGRDGPGLLPGARLHGRRGRGRRRDRRGRGARDVQRLRDRPRAQPGDGDAADRGRRLDGHVARAVRDDRALLPRARPRADRLQRVPDARARPTTRRCRA